ncbi:hypothetical protein N7G274_006895 [Stereocaulon virgatum]|uniref:Uncharacterized protein n=1 Tax=Stereocaulon virgatum TaxID=373712 RepID=A0ABR4A3F1_9LECA
MKPYVLAIPVAMSGGPCAETTRLWLLRPSETASDGSWKIVEKVQFMTLEPITENWAGIERRNKQIIRGSSSHREPPTSFQGSTHEVPAKIAQIQ